MSKLLVLCLVTIVWIHLAYCKGLKIKRSVCAENEVEIQSAHCGPKRCEDLGYPIPCGGASSLWSPECVCVDGFVRNDDDKCVPKTECSSCGGDPNAMTGCGNHCGNSCSDYQQVNKTCLSGCRYNGCDCKPGYVHHEDRNKCVMPADC